ncbi:MAG: ABC transporter permease, partial [Clostridiales bacterium]|nr:ABC transporter permease [Clostridiales bacterium]
RESFFALYGGLFFLGLFLGFLFIMATVLIMYYKQVSEGYDDKQRFEIMQKVGLSKEEVKKTIKSQVLMVFFLPLLMAIIHIAFAFKVITKLLAVLNLTNVTLFALCTVGTILVFAVFYGIVYSLTARVYYKLVS